MPLTLCRFWKCKTAGTPKQGNKEKREGRIINFKKKSMAISNGDQLRLNCKLGASESSKYKI